MSKPTKTGTREWSEQSINCCVGCAHACLYCYARANALRFGRLTRGGDWAEERPAGDDQIAAGIGLRMVQPGQGEELRSRYLPGRLLGSG